MIANKNDVLARLFKLIGQAASLPDDDLRTKPELTNDLGCQISMLSCDLNDATYVPETADEEVLREVATKVALKERDYLSHSTRIHHNVARIFGLIAHKAPQVIMEREFQLLGRAIEAVEEKYKEEKF